MKYIVDVCKKRLFINSDKIITHTSPVRWFSFWFWFSRELNNIPKKEK